MDGCDGRLIITSNKMCPNFPNFLRFCHFSNILTALPEQKSVRALVPCWYSFSVILQAACYSFRKQKTGCLRQTASTRTKLMFTFKSVLQHHPLLFRVIHRKLLLISPLKQICQPLFEYYSRTKKSRPWSHRAFLIKDTFHQCCCHLILEKY